MEQSKRPFMSSVIHKDGTKLERLGNVIVAVTPKDGHKATDEEWAKYVTWYWQYIGTPLEGE